MSELKQKSPGKAPEKVTAQAHANIALVKYWGKQPGPDHIPATPSISLALDKLVTKTTVNRSKDRSDHFQINNSAPDGTAFHRLARYLETWRKEKLIEGNFQVSSENSFPTKAGLASSASGFAALAMALSAFSEEKLSSEEISRLARRGSGSAARSIPGSLAIMPLSDDPMSKVLLPADEVPWGMVVAVVSGGKKHMGSTEAMELSRQTSPFFATWIEQAKRDYTDMLAAIEKLDFTRVGEISEGNAKSMHACMMATRPALIYWSGTTVEIIRAAQQWRDDGLETYVTIDAGHHVALLGKLENLDKIAKKTSKIHGVTKALICKPAGGAEILESE